MLWLSTAICTACGFVGMNLSYHLDVPSGTTVVLTGATVFGVVLARPAASGCVAPPALTYPTATCLPTARRTDVETAEPSHTSSLHAQRSFVTCEDAGSNGAQP